MPLIVIDSATFNRVSEYADTANLSIDSAIVSIINEWMDSTGDLILAEVQPKMCIRDSTSSFVWVWHFWYFWYWY